MYSSDVQVIIYRGEHFRLLFFQHWGHYRLEICPFCIVKGHLYTVFFMEDVLA